MFKCPFGDWVYEENCVYVGLTTTTLSRQLTMHFNDSRSIALHIKTHSIPKSKFWKILVENTTIIAHENDKLWLQILEALHIKAKKKLKSIELILRIVTMFRNATRIFFLKHSVFLDSILFPLTAFCFFKLISHSVLSNSVFAYFVMFQKTFKTHFQKQHSLYMQATPDDGLWRVRKCLGQFL